MQYVEYVKLALGVMGLLIDIARDIKAGGNSDNVTSIVDRLLSSVKSVGIVADVKELKDLDLAPLAPLVKDFISKIHELKALNK